MFLAVLGLFGDRPLATSNALKSLLSFALNVSAAAFLTFSGKLVTVIPARRLRPLIVTFAFVVAIAYLVK
jgi:hypothetical protein